MAAPIMEPACCPSLSFMAMKEEMKFSTILNALCDTTLAANTCVILFVLSLFNFSIYLLHHLITSTQSKTKSLLFGIDHLFKVTISCPGNSFCDVTLFGDKYSVSNPRYFLNVLLTLLLTLLYTLLPHSVEYENYLLWLLTAVACK